jgi:predicted ArsR family transcriptional regulator
VQQRIVGLLAQPRSADDLARSLGLELPTHRSELTMLEHQNRVVRRGSAFALPGRGAPS